VIFQQHSRVIFVKQVTFEKFPNVPTTFIVVKQRKMPLTILH